jgi:hypothetical protein
MMQEFGKKQLHQVWCAKKNSITVVNELSVLVGECTQAQIDFVFGV